VDDDGLVVCVVDSFPGPSTAGVAWASSLSSMRGTINLWLEKKEKKIFIFISISIIKEFVEA
jgi:hypothetical protein